MSLAEPKPINWHRTSSLAAETGKSYFGGTDGALRVLLAKASDFSITLCWVLEEFLDLRQKVRYKRPSGVRVARPKERNKSEQSHVVKRKNQKQKSISPCKLGKTFWHTLLLLIDKIVYKTWVKLTFHL